MQAKIYKINNITFDEQNQEFCLSHDHGIKTFDIEQFSEKETSDNFEFELGNISLAHFFPKFDDLIVFIGSKKNKDFPPNTIIFFDIREKKIIFKKVFDKVITNFKCVSNFIFISFGTSLIIYSYDENKNELEQKEEHKIESNSLFECWMEKPDEFCNSLYLSFPYEQELIILMYTIKEWSYDKKLNIPSPVKKIQNIFFIRKLNKIFISDQNAKYIYGFDIDTAEKKLCLNRGSNPGFITSITLLNDGKFLAVNNLDRTIHIFDLDINNNYFSFSNIFYGIVSDIKEIYPKIRIHYEDIIQKGEGNFYKKDFAEKGAVLFSDNNNELNIICYNGLAFKININFKELSYKTTLKMEYLEQKLKNISLYTSGCELEKK